MSAITVRQVISKLKKMPQNAYVGWQNHDQCNHEIDGFIAYVGLADDELYHHPDNAQQTEWLNGRPVVVLGT